MSLADERDVQLRLHARQPGSGSAITAITQVLTVVGNLIDNAIDAAALGAGAARVELTLVAAESDLLIRVRDTGPGVPHDMREADLHRRRHHEVLGDRRAARPRARPGPADRRGLGGMVSVGHDGGAVFTAVLPGCVGADGPAGQVPDASLPVPRPRVVS